MTHSSVPERTVLGRDLEISRVLTGLWQIADMERDGNALDPVQAADHLKSYVDQGYTTFDMADHYGSAELVAGELLSRQWQANKRPLAFTKWCPEPGPMDLETVEQGVRERLERLGVDQIDLLQFHWWTFDHPAWLDALHHLNTLKERGWIREIGVTNFDAAHLRLALADDIPIVSNQVSFSMVDRRAAGALAKVCQAHNVKLLAYGTLCGGFLSGKWLGKPEPDEIPDWSSMKYKRFIDVAGGWAAYQNLLETCNQIARKHEVSISNVATRWVIEHPFVAGTIIGARLGESEHRQDNLQLFGFSLDQDNHDALNNAFDQMALIPGDCGDEYRKPPFLTASGDLAHHLDEIKPAYDTQVDNESFATPRTKVLTGSKWEDIAGYCRAVKIGNRILVSGTTATAGNDRMVAPEDAGAQATFILDKISASLKPLGATMDQVVRTRIYLVDEDDTLAVSEAHGRIFNQIKPANTLVVVNRLIGGYRVEIEAEAIID